MAKREILFRGWNEKNKKWIYGYYLVNRGEHFIAPDEFVNPLACLLYTSPSPRDS